MKAPTAAPLLCLSALLAAHGAAAAPKKIEEVVVTAAPFSQPVSTIPGSVMVVSKPQIEQQALVSNGIADMLGKLVPGLAPSTGSLSNFGQSFRGRKVVVMVDGVMMTTNLRDGGRSLQTISPAAIDRIEVIKGASAFYGNGEAGAIVNIVTKQPSADNEWETGVAVDFFPSEISDAGYRLDHTMSGKFDNGLGYLLSLAKQDRGELYDSNGDELPGSPSNQGGFGNSTEEDVLLKVEKDFDDQLLQLTSRYYRIDNYINFSNILDQSTGLVAIDPTKPYVGPDPYTKITQVQVRYENQEILGQALSSYIYYSENDVGYQSNSVIISRVTGGRFALRAGAADGINLTYGIDLARTTTEQSSKTTGICDICDAEETKTSPFAQLSVPIGERWQLQTGLRYEVLRVDIPDYRVSGGSRQFIDGGTLDYDKLLFNIGTVWKWTDELEWFAGFSQGYSITDLRMLRGLPARFSSVDQLDSLIPATASDYYETGLRFDGERWQASLALFYSDVENGYSYDSNAKVPAADRIEGLVVRDEYTYGIEVTGDFQFDEHWRAGGQVSWAEGERDNPYGSDYYMNGTRIAPIKVNLYVGYSPWAGWDNRLQWNYVDDRDRFDPVANDAVSGIPLYNNYESPVDDYDSMDFISQYQWDRHTVSLGITNLLDEKYVPVAAQLNKAVNNTPAFRSGYAGPGRQITLGYRIRY